MGAGHGIGITRNDYRKRNRRRNISTWSRSHGYNKQSQSKIVPYVSEVRVVELPRYELVTKAKLWRSNPKAASISTICFDYVRHELTNYDELRKTFTGRAAQGEDWLWILGRVCDAIAEKYPWLNREAARHYKDAGTRQRSRIRIVKRPDTLTQIQLAEYNNAEEEKWKGILAALEQEEQAREDEEVNLSGVICGLASSRLLFMPPFLSAEDIKKRRFESGLDSNDNWWEWEKELNLSRYEFTKGRPNETID